MWFMVYGKTNKIVRLFSLVLSICILCALFTLPSVVSSASNSKELVDIKAHWAEIEINKWVSQDLVKGYGNGRFGPNDSITRAEFVTLLNRIFGYQQTSEKSFPDVKGRGMVCTGNCEGISGRDYRR
ncbi:MAG: S-layer homology domain-containing protein [Clostridiaceae bacterium]|jgi:mannan endo-1,4-beta-mannosidase|nr:S-layer homology domain-containing protein [Clostridiaceae bacterium]